MTNNPYESPVTVSSPVRNRLELWQVLLVLATLDLLFYVVYLLFTFMYLVLGGILLPLWPAVVTFVLWWPLSWITDLLHWRATERQLRQ